MLNYAGKGQIFVEPVNISQIIEDARKLLEISVSKKAVLKCELASDLPAIQADPSQIHQILLNLVINASEALGDNSGVIVISTDAICANRPARPPQTAWMICPRATAFAWRSPTPAVGWISKR